MLLIHGKKITMNASDSALDEKNTVPRQNRHPRVQSRAFSGFQTGTWMTKALSQKHAGVVPTNGVPLIPTPQTSVDHPFSKQHMFIFGFQNHELIVTPIRKRLEDEPPTPTAPTPTPVPFAFLGSACVQHSARCSRHGRGCP